MPTFKSKLAELEKYMDNAPLSNVDKIDNIIDMYEDRKIANFKTALNVVKLLASHHKIIIDSGKADKKYYEVRNNNVFTEPRTRLTAPKYKSTFHVTRGNYKKPLTTTKIEIRKGKFIDHVFKNAEPIVINELKIALTLKKSFKTKLRMEILIEREKMDSNGQMHHTLLKEMISTVTPPRAITNGNVVSTAISEFEALKEKCKEEGTAGEQGTGWIIKKFLNIFIDIYETKPIRAASYIPTPQQFNNSRCGLINIQNDDQECFKWCMKYHQSAKDKNASRICKLKKVVDKYNYEEIEYPTSYDDIYRFEELNKVCIYVFTLTENNDIIKDKEGTANYIHNELIYLLRIEEEGNSHYI